MAREIRFAALVLTGISLVHAQTPVISLSVNGGSEVTVPQNYPLVIQAAFYHPNVLAADATTVTPLVLADQQGSWSNSAQLTMADSTGAPQSWPVQLALAPPGPLSLGAGTAGVLVWTAGADFTRTIALGTYSASVTLNTTQAFSGWIGSVSSATATIQIVPPLSSPNTDQVEDQYRALATYDAVQGNISQAISDLGTLLAQQPQSIGGLALNAQILADSGQTAQALAMYSQAIDAFYAQNPSPSEPPNHLLAPQQDLLEQMVSQTRSPQIVISVIAHGTNENGEAYCDLVLTNTGSKPASQVVIDNLTLKSCSGAARAQNGVISYAPALSPVLPITIQKLFPNGSQKLRIFSAH